MELSVSDLSRAVSHALRHEPWLYELELDEEGWAPVDQLVVALRARGGRWSEVDGPALERMVASAPGQRFELDGRRVRALYGHSLAGRVRRVAAPPPDQLFHGTSPQAWSTIAQEGLTPAGRQYVHLSSDLRTARAVGLRKGRAPVLLVVDAAAAATAGVTFYRGNALVWLADLVPPRFLARVTWEPPTGSPPAGTRPSRPRRGSRGRG